MLVCYRGLTMSAVPEQKKINTLMLTRLVFKVGIRCMFLEHNVSAPGFVQGGFDFRRLVEEIYRDNRNDHLISLPCVQPIILLFSRPVSLVLPSGTYMRWKFIFVL